MRSLEPRHRLIEALRVQRDEAQITRAIASVLSSDGTMAAAFVAVVLAGAPRRDRIVFRVPSELGCRAEESLDDGRADLSFIDSEREHRALLELKVHSGYGDDQILRYLKSLPTDPVKNVLAAITRTVPTYGDEHDDPRWAGSIRWGRLVDGLRGLRPSDDDLAAQWSVLIDVLEQEGAMGFTGDDAEMLAAWAKAAPARDHAEEFVNVLRLPLLDVLRRELVAGGLAQDPLRAASSFSRGRRGQRVVFPQRGKMQVRFCVPAGATVRVKAGLWGWGDLNFTVEVPYPAGEGAADAAARLEAAGFKHWRHRLLERFLPLPIAEIQSEQVQERIVAFATESFRALVTSGFFDLGLVADEGDDAELDSDV
jgi:hypothetical protein